MTRSRPANAPARPTLPMRSKSTRGELASAAWAHIASRKAVIMRGEHDLHAIACWGGVSCTTRERRDKRVRYEARGQGVEWLATRHQRARYSTFAYVSNSHTRYIHQRLHRFKCCSTNLVVYNVNPQRSTNTSSFLCPGDNLELFSMNKLALSTSSQCKIGLCEDLNQYCLSGTPGLGWHVSRSQDRYPVVGCGGPAGLRVASVLASSARRR